MHEVVWCAWKNLLTMLHKARLLQRTVGVQQPLRSRAEPWQEPRKSGASPSAKTRSGSRLDKLRFRPLPIQARTLPRRAVGGAHRVWPPRAGAAAWDSLGRHVESMEGSDGCVGETSEAELNGRSGTARPGMQGRRGWYFTKILLVYIATINRDLN